MRRETDNCAVHRIVRRNEQGWKEEGEEFAIKVVTRVENKSGKKIWLRLYFQSRTEDLICRTNTAWPLTNFLFSFDVHRFCQAFQVGLWMITQKLQKLKNGNFRSERDGHFWIDKGDDLPARCDNSLDTKPPGIWKRDHLDFTFAVLVKITKTDSLDPRF